MAACASRPGPTVGDRGDRVIAMSSCIDEVMTRVTAQLVASRAARAGHFRATRHFAHAGQAPPGVRWLPR